MGGAGVALSDDVLGILRNPALSAWGRTGAGFDWSEQFGLPELAREAVGARFLIKGQPFSVHGGSLGNDLYRESDFSVGISRAVRPEVAVGIDVGGRWLDLRGYSVGRALAISAGVVARPVSSVAIGAVWTNANAPKLSGFMDRLPESLTVGIAATIARNGVIVADIVQEKSFPAEFRLGAEMRVLPGFYLRVGGRAEPVRPSAGFQVDIRRWAFSYAGDLHPDLGASHEVGLEYRFGP
jgi:hypothetical protein